MADLKIMLALIQNNSRRHTLCHICLHNTSFLQVKVRLGDVTPAEIR